MGRLYDATQAAIERKNAVAQDNDDPPQASDDVFARIFYDFDVDLEDLDTYIRQGIDYAIDRAGITGEIPDSFINALGDTIVNGLLTGLYHERMRASE